jgi:beta-glucosidase
MNILFRFLAFFLKQKNNKSTSTVNISNPKPEHNILNPTDISLKSSLFGKGFIWGAASSAFQTEGSTNTDGKGLSIWDTFTRTDKKLKEKSIFEEATDFYNLYSTDLELLKEMNFNSFRFSLSWPRILPDGIGQVNQKGVDFYNRLIDACLESNIEPWVTLYHWDLPQKLQDKNGWANRDIVGWFGEYVGKVSRLYGDRVKNWMILNEPMAFTSLGYLFGIHAPGKNGFRNFLPAVHHVALCQATGGRIIRESVHWANIGTTYSCSVVEPVDHQPKNIRASRKIDAALNRLFIEPALGLGYPLDDLPFLKRIDQYIQENDLEQLKFDFDFIGLQYYYRIIVRHHYLPPFNAIEIKPAYRGALTNEMGFEVYPEGMYKILKKYAAYPQIRKFIITESGVCYYDLIDKRNSINDMDRIKYHQDILTWALKAKNEGIPVEGYFVWSLTDNVEWMEGTYPRFGLVYIDYKTKMRLLKDSGKWFREFLKIQ